MRFWFLLLFCYHTIRCDVSISTIFLVNQDAFSRSTYEGILSQFGDTSAIQSVEGFVITGAEAKKNYFPKSNLLAFQLVHLTRVRATIVTKDDSNTSAYLNQFLEPNCLRRIGPMAFDLPPAQTPFDLLQQIPPSISIATTALWLLTVIAWTVHCIVARCQAEEVVKSVSQSGPCAVPMPSLGPAAIRLVSWTPEKDSRRP